MNLRPDAHIVWLALLLPLLGLLLGGCGADRLPPSASGLPSWARIAPEQLAEAIAHDVPVAFENDLGIRFVLIPSGTFHMGSPEDEVGRDPGEAQHEVTISRPFYMSIHELTNAQYFGGGVPVLREDPDWLQKPVVDAKWDWANHPQVRFGRDHGGRTYSLPTEAQWEYACRAGTTTPYSTGEELTLVQARFSELDIVPCGSYPPNAWGLYDMHGNVEEWCLDWYGSYPTTTSRDPTGPSTGTYRVVRGGTHGGAKEEARSAARGMAPPDRKGHGDRGLRLVSPLPEE